MGFFEGAKHKIEEVAGKVEEFIGNARGDSAMSAAGNAHAEHGEALIEQDEQRAGDHKDHPDADGERERAES
ncbi:MAG: hypothetical protein ACK5MR_16410 [Cumulibacter sp.]